MAHVAVTVNGRSYTVACDDGEEEHLRHLAEYLDRHVRQLADQVGAVGDSRLLLMAGLLVADELSSALGRLEQIEKDVERLNTARSVLQKRLGRSEQAAADALSKAAGRVEAIARRVEAS